MKLLEISSIEPIIGIKSSLDVIEIRTIKHVLGTNVIISSILVGFFFLFRLQEKEFWFVLPPTHPPPPFDYSNYYLKLIILGLSYVSFVVPCYYFCTFCYFLRLVI